MHWSADDSFFQCQKQADYNLGISIPFFKNPEGTREKMAEAEAMLTIVRKPTKMEKRALATRRSSGLLCLDKFYIDNPQLTRATVVPGSLDLLREGVITFAEYAKERIKELREIERLITQYEREEQERRKLEERNRPITLSCIVSINNSEARFDSEHQFQINEEAKTIWASRGPAAPSSINIGPTEITFKQGDTSVRISRNTGLFSLTSGSYVWSGTCQTITQRKF